MKQNSKWSCVKDYFYYRRKDRSFNGLISRREFIKTDSDSLSGINTNLRDSYVTLMCKIGLIARVKIGRNTYYKIISVDSRVWELSISEARQIAYPKPPASVTSYKKHGVDLYCTPSGVVSIAGTLTEGKDIQKVITFLQASQKYILRLNSLEGPKVNKDRKEQDLKNAKGRLISANELHNYKKLASSARSWFNSELSEDMATHQLAMSRALNGLKHK